MSKELPKPPPTRIVRDDCGEIVILGIVAITAIVVDIIILFTEVLK